MSEYQFRHDRAGYTGSLRVHIESTGSYGAPGVNGLGQGSGFADGIINLAGLLKSAAENAPPYIGAGTVPGGDFVPPDLRLTVYQGATAISSLTFAPIETAAGIVDINTLLSQGKAVAATPAQLLSLVAAAAELEAQNGTFGQTLTAIQAALADTEQSSDYAKGLTGVAGQDIYTENETPAARPDGTQGIQYRANGLWGRIKRVASVWVDYGSPMLSLLGLKLRLGYNVLDYAQYVVGDDWSPAFQAMFNEAPASATVSAPSRDFIIRGPLVAGKPFNYRMGAATLLSTGDAFLPDTVSAPEGQLPLFMTGNPRPALDILTRLGNGSFGDNPAFGNASLKGSLPHIKRVGNPQANRKDGSVGLRIVNAYFPELIFGNIEDFQIGAVVDAFKTGSGERGTSHGKFYLNRFANIQNLIFIGRGPGTGWCTENQTFKGSFGTPAIAGLPASAPADHYHIISIGTNLGWNNQNTFNQPACEAQGKHALYAYGAQQENMLFRPRLEMPNAADGKLVKIVRDVAFSDAGNGGKSYAWNIIGGYGLTAANIDDSGGVFTEFRRNTYQGLYEYFDGILKMRPSASSGVPYTREWYLDGPQKAKAYTYTGSETAGVPLQIDLGLYRNITVNVATGATVVAGGIQAINAPATMDYDFQLTIFQASAGNTVAPAFLAGGVFYGIYPAPVKRNSGTDTYRLATIAGAATGAGVAVLGHSSRNYTASATGVRLPLFDTGPLASRTAAYDATTSYIQGLGALASKTATAATPNVASATAQVDHVEFSTTVLGGHGVWIDTSVTKRFVLLKNVLPAGGGGRWRVVCFDAAGARILTGAELTEAASLSANATYAAWLEGSDTAATETTITVSATVQKIFVMLGGGASVAKIVSWGVDAYGSTRAYTGLTGIIPNERENWVTQAPAFGYGLADRKVYKVASAAGGKIGWVCVTAGTPGAWKPWGAIDA